MPKELEKLPPSKLRDKVIRLALQGEFHDYKNQMFATPKIALVNFLKQLNANEIKQQVTRGVYDEEMDDTDKEAMIKDLEELDPSGAIKDLLKLDEKTDDAEKTETKKKKSKRRRVKKEKNDSL